MNEFGVKQFAQQQAVKSIYVSLLLYNPLQPQESIFLKTLLGVSVRRRQAFLGLPIHNPMKITHKIVEHSSRKKVKSGFSEENFSLG